VTALACGAAAPDRVPWAATTGAHGAHQSAAAQSTATQRNKWVEFTVRRFRFKE